jgi:4,5-DOPA dioxygenase extradiol
LTPRYEEVKSSLINRDHAKLIDYQELKGSHLAVPTLDHYLPMIYTLALQEEGEPLKFTYEGFQHGSISMRCFQIGSTMEIFVKSAFGKVFNILPP